MALTESIARDTLKELDDIKKQISFSLKSLNNMFVAAVKNNPEANVKFKEDFAATMDSLKNMQANIGKMTETMENYSNSEVIDISFPNTFAKDYLQAKMQHQDSILMYKYGDYYVMVGDDAEKAAHILEMPTQKAALGGSKDDTVLVIPQSYAAFYGDRVKATHESVVMVKDTPTAVLTPQQELEMNIPKEYRPFFNVMKQSGKTREEVREIIANPEGFEHLLPGDIKHDVKDLDTVIDETFKSGIPDAEKNNIEKTAEPRPDWLDYFADEKGNSPKTIGDLMHDMYFGDIHQPLPTASLRACFHRYCSALDEQIEMTMSPLVAPDDKKTYRETLAQRGKEFRTAITEYFNIQHKVIVAAVAAGLSPEDTVRYLEKKPKDMPEALRNALPDKMRIPASKMMSSQQIVNRGPIAPGEAYDILQNNAKNFEDYNRALTKYFPMMEDVRSAVESEAGLTPPTGRIADQEKGYEILSWLKEYEFLTNSHCPHPVIKIPENIDDFITCLELDVPCINKELPTKTDKIVASKFEAYMSAYAAYADMRFRNDNYLNLTERGTFYQVDLEPYKNKKTSCREELISALNEYHSRMSKVQSLQDNLKEHPTAIYSESDDNHVIRFGKYEHVTLEEIYALAQALPDVHIWGDNSGKNAGQIYCTELREAERFRAMIEKLNVKRGERTPIVENLTMDIEYKGKTYSDVTFPDLIATDTVELYSEAGVWTASKLGDDMIDFHIFSEPEKFFYFDRGRGKALSVDAVLCEYDKKNKEYSQTRGLELHGLNPEIKISNIRTTTNYCDTEVQLLNGLMMNEGNYSLEKKDTDDMNEVLPEEEGIDEEKEVSRGFHR